MAHTNYSGYNQRLYLESACARSSQVGLAILGNHDQDTDTATINQAVQQVPGTQLLIHKPTLLHRKSEPNQGMQLSRQIRGGHFRRQ